MATPTERLNKIIESYTPSEVRFKGHIGDTNGELQLRSFRVRDLSFTYPESDEKLFMALKDNFREIWNAEAGHYYIPVTVIDLFRHIKTTIIQQYAYFSSRSPATKRKTECFIRDVLLDQPMANFLLHMFIEIDSSEFNRKTRAEKEAFFESLELMRRNYGKRS